MHENHKRRFWVLLAVMLIFPLARAGIGQTLSFDWVARAGGASYERVYGVAVDPLGNAFVAGRFSSSSLLVAGLNLSTAGGDDIFVGKVDRFGNWLWVRGVGGSAAEEAIGIATDSAGNAVVVGQFQSSVIQFGATRLTNSNTSALDGFIAKIDGNGNWIWAKNPIGNSRESISGVHVAASDEIYVAGAFQSSTLTVGATILTNNSGGLSSAFVGKLSGSGTWLWARATQGASAGFGGCVSDPISGGVVVVGGYQATNIVLGSLSVSNSGLTDMVVAKLDASGGWLWATNAAGAAEDFVKGIAVDRSGACYIAGYFQSPSLAVGGTNLTKIGGDDVFVGKIAPDGNWVWASQAANAGAWSVTVASAGDIYVGVNTRQTSVTFGANTVVNARFGFSDMMVAGLDPNGNWIAATGAGGSRDDESYAIAADRSGGIVWGGFFQSSPTAFGGFSYSVVGTEDLFVARLPTPPGLILTPTFTLQPQAQQAVAGSPVVFSTTASGTPLLSYQWRKDGVAIPGANAAALTLPNVQPSSGGAYSVVVSNSAGTATSTSALLTVVPLVITQPPPSFRTAPGTSVTFSVGASGVGPFTYQWRFNGGNLPGATAATLTLTNVQVANNGGYSVVVGNAFGTVASVAGTLDVLTPPVITEQPIGVTTLAGEVVAFAVSVSGSAPFAYQWRRDGTNLPGATANPYTLPSAQATEAGLYSVLVSNEAGVAVSSNAALVVQSGPIIITPPGARVVGASSSVSFSVGVVGEAPFTYQWRLNGTNIPGASGMSFSIGAVTPSHEGLYSVVVSNSLGSATSSAARLTVLPISVVVPWAATGGGGGSDVGNAIAVDAAGNSYVAGYFSGTATFGTNTLVSAGNTDIFITKQNSSGQVLWARRAGGPGYDAAKGIAVDALGNCYVTGAYEGEASFSGSTSLTNTSPTSYADVFLAQYDAAGTLVWARSAGVEFANDEGTAVAVDSAGNVLVTGRSVLDTFAGAPVVNAGRIFVAKYTSAGAEVWARKAGSYTGGNQDTGTGIATDNAGNVFVGGVFQSPVATFGIGTFTNYGNADMFLAKFDAAGTLQWARQAGGAGEDTASGVAVAADGSAYLVGAVAGNANFSGTNVTSLAGAASDGFIAKYAGDGRVTWVRQFGGGGLSAARAVAVDAAGTVHVTGYFSGGVTFGTNTLRGISGSYDAFLARLDAAGVFAFVQQAGGADLSGDFGLGVGVDAAGNSVITGYFSGTSTVGGNSLPSRGAEDVLVTRFNQFTGGGVPQVGFQPLGGRLRMRWPLAASSYILQSTTNLLNPVWIDEPNALTLNGSDLETEVPVGNQVRFFRLRKP